MQSRWGKAAFLTCLLLGVMFSILLSLAACILGPPSYSVRYNGNDNTSGTPPVDNHRYVEGEIATVLGNSENLAKTGFVFGGWNTRSDGKGTDYDQSASLVIKNSNITLYAKWIKYYSDLEPLVCGTQVSLASLNGSNVYTLVSTKPDHRSEGNIRTDSLRKSFTLSSTAGPTTSLAPMAETGVETQKRSKAYGLPRAFGDGQVKSDEKIRQAENDVLASGVRQLSGAKEKGPMAAPSQIDVGTEWDNVHIVSTSPLMLIDTVCVAVSASAYFFSDTRDISNVNDYLLRYGYAEAMDAIVGVDRHKFGHENDVDGNGKIIVVFSQELANGLLGYFNPQDKYPSSRFTTSNEGDIIYVTTDPHYQGTNGNILKATFAHELQHMIYFDEHYNRHVTSTYTWLNEALSQAAEYYNGYTENHLDWINSFLVPGSEHRDWRGLSLTYWTNDNYGYGAVFIRYLIDQYGDTAIRNLCSTDKIGIAAVEAATNDAFNNIFSNFTKALVLSGTNESIDPKYRFTTLNLQTVQPTGRGGLLPSLTCAAGSTARDISIYPYEISFYQWSGTLGTMTLSGSGFFGTAFGLSG